MYQEPFSYIGRTALLMLESETCSVRDWETVPSRFQRHYRSGNYRRPHSSRSGVKAGLLDFPICAIDGEGKTRPDGSHDYTLLAASWPDGKHAISGSSLDTRECLDFLLDLPERHTYVIYGGSYDFNMMLSKMPLEAIDRLLDTGQVYWSNYRIRWIERKFLNVKRGKRSVTVYDVLANFQTSFVKACSAWQVGTPTELDLVAAMKEQRGDFNNVDDAAIDAYCYLECDLLRQLCRKLFDAIIETPYRPNAVYGPGALAAAAFRHHGVKRRMNDLPPEVEELTHYAYFGGRFDCSAFGWFQDAIQYDIKSAYPDQIRYLPCLAHATWRHDTPGLDGLYPEHFGMYHVEWNVGEDAVWPPFPHRDASGNVFYPYKGAGWYHGEEIRAAIEMYGADRIRVIEGWAVVPGCEHKPFDFVDNLFEIRKRLPYEQGIVFKLILNSLYGKLAQQVGGKDGKPPTFQCFYWAGAITSGTRAKILRALVQSPREILGIATDGIVSLRELDLDIGDNLGEWERKQLESYAQISNGVYDAVTIDGSRVERSRGFNRGTLDWEHVRSDFVKSRGTGKHVFRAKSRFVTLREARLHLDRRSVQCRWIEQDRTLSFWPSRRWPEHFDKRGPAMRLAPLAPDDYGGEHESRPFRVKARSQEVIDARIRFNGYAAQDNG